MRKIYAALIIAFFILNTTVAIAEEAEQKTATLQLNLVVHPLCVIAFEGSNVSSESDTRTIDTKLAASAAGNSLYSSVSEDYTVFALTNLPGYALKPEDKQKIDYFFKHITFSSNNSTSTSKPLLNASDTYSSNFKLNDEKIPYTVNWKEPKIEHDNMEFFTANLHVNVAADDLNKAADSGTYTDIITLTLSCE